MLTVLIPCFNEEKNIINFIKNFKKKVNFQNYELIFINDYGSDNFKKLKKDFGNKKIIFIQNKFLKGLGGTLNSGINKSKGKYVSIMMADLSDRVEDLNKYYFKIKNDNLDAVFGSRFVDGSILINYPKKKLLLNRIFNLFVKLIYFSSYNDFTNAFKIYKLTYLKKIKPFYSSHFNIFLEFSLRLINRNLNFDIISISWQNRKDGKSNFYIRELGSRYLSTLFKCYIEKYEIKKK